MADQVKTDPTPKSSNDATPMAVVIGASILIGALIGTGLYLLGSKKPFGKR